ncbi:MAG: hydrogenase maturation nickel metallochaperone HypA [Actinobacteria bacterium]|nr:hydrogenase maturation nickel metallochaperone HypA [Actinomycetota bacterium]
MHELGLIQSVIESVDESAKAAGATAVLEIHLKVGEMTEAVAEALEFAFEALSANTICEGAKLDIAFIQPRSHCLACDHEYTHDRYHISCPKCSSFSTELLCGRELYIDSIEVDIPDGDEDEETVCI